MAAFVGSALVVLVFVGLAALLFLAYRFVTGLTRPQAPAPDVQHVRRAMPVDLREGQRMGYFVTFEFDDGTRSSEFQIWGEEYVRLECGQWGMLTYRGDSYQSFEPMLP